MPDTPTIQRDTLTPELFLQLYRSVGWEAPGIDQVRTALANTAATFTAMLNDEPVGMVRLIGDGGMSFYIKDFAVVPSVQSQGVGHALLAELEHYVQQSIAPGWAVSLELISRKAPLDSTSGTGSRYAPTNGTAPACSRWCARRRGIAA